MPPTPTVAIVGRPNVGKSTLFNRLIGRRQAIVHNQPGVTRDRIAARVELDGRTLELVDTGGLAPGNDPLGLGEQVFLAIGASDLVLLVTDGQEGLLPADQAVWEAVRKTGKATWLVVNKGDTRAAREQLPEFYRLGVGEPLLVSAEHGSGIGELRERLAARFAASPVEEEEEVPGLAIVGRPNVGKSSILNRLLGETRVLVAAAAGTTRDPVDTLVERGTTRLRVVDTAGIRRRSRLSGPEELAVLFARRQMERADAVLLVVDAAAGVTSGDLAIAGQAWELGRSVAVAVNKWDLLDGAARERLDASWPRLEELLARPPRINVSALTGRGIDRIFPAIEALLARHRSQLTTGEVNRLFHAAVARHQPPASRGRPWKLYYATQLAVAPPTFLLFANRTLERRGSYRRYLENQVREALDLSGVPLRLVVRRRQR